MLPHRTNKKMCIGVDGYVILIAIVGLIVTATCLWDQEDSNKSQSIS